MVVSILREEFNLDLIDGAVCGERFRINLGDSPSLSSGDVAVSLGVVSFLLIFFGYRV
jgi:hypothetical protein